MQTFEQINEASADSARMLKTDQRCSHCGISVSKGNLYCDDCRTAPKRQEMCQENKQLILNWKCRLCRI